jgi:SAM-dependent methyltransferase
LDDKYLKSFDRRYRVKTSGFILLPTTSFDPARIRDATQYAPAYGWAVRRLLKQLNLPRKLHFADLSRGLGRICILAAEYGSAKVTGVDLAPEFCATARENATNCRPPSGCFSPITILQMDVLDLCETTDDDVFFMFRPFSGKFLKLILDTLAARARSRNKSLTIIYSERAAVPGNYASTIAPNPAFRHQCEAVFWGQAFHVFQCNGNPSGAAV